MSNLIISNTTLLVLQQLFDFIHMVALNLVSCKLVRLHQKTTLTIGVPVNLPIHKFMTKISYKYFVNVQNDVKVYYLNAKTQPFYSLLLFVNANLN